MTSPQRRDAAGGWWKTLVLSLLLQGGLVSSLDYYGKPLGSFNPLEHQIAGDVYAVDSRTLHIRNFNYDGQGPDAYFYAGEGTVPSEQGFIIPDENGSTEPLGRYNRKHITLTLPNSHSLDRVQWISVWCSAFRVDFGNVILPGPVVDYPKPEKVGRLKTLEHGVSSGEMVIVDAQTLLIPEFSYDGSAPDAHFWVGRGTPGPDGVVVPDENGETIPLRDYRRKTIVVTLPGDLTVFDIDYLSVWCEDFFVDFGHIQLNAGNRLVPPSLKMLGVKPQSKLNCEQLDADLSFEVRWAVAGESIVMQLVSRIEDGEYMAFGLSGDARASRMEGGDVVAAWLDRSSGQGFAVDYHLESKSQCAGGRGSCPDVKLGGEDQVRLLNSALISGFSMLTLQRPLTPFDRRDKAVLTNGSQPIIWAVGPLNSAGEVSYHSRRTQSTKLVDFGRNPVWNCPEAGARRSTSSRASTSSRGSTSSSGSRRRPSTGQRGQTPARRAQPSSRRRPAASWKIPAVPCYEPADGVFYAQIGPSGGERGYTAITGRVGWGIAWYINGLLVPEVNVVRGKRYTFVVEGGDNLDNSARRHPFYITDDPEGGYHHKTPEERKSVRVFAGVSVDARGEAQPTASGRLCQWTEDPESPAQEHGSFGAYQRTLSLVCDQGQPAVLDWTPDQNTPDTVYYQCFTHRYLGWKINVVDSCDDNGSVSGRSRGRQGSGGRRRG